MRAGRLPGRRQPQAVVCRYRPLHRPAHLWRGSESDVSAIRSIATSLAQTPQNPKRDESGTGRDEPGSSGDESAEGWKESAARGVANRCPAERTSQRYRAGPLATPSPVMGVTVNLCSRAALPIRPL
jgi:hypothetical protein